ncbi:MAG: DUF1425 domain-containing protein [Planctomycetes bacterium]|nr:DUF1425 domain-containing protein [Planctomycetota bacterium]
MKKTLHRILSLTLMVVCAAFIAGCISSATSVIEKRGETYKVTANSLVLKNKLSFSERSTRRVNDLLEAQIRGQNTSRRDVQFEYRFVWLDRDGIEVDTATSFWKPLALHAKEDALMKGMSPSAGATDFILEVRFVHPSTRW